MKTFVTGGTGHVGAIRLLNGGKRADIGKARRELGYAPTPVFDALREQYEFFRERGVLA